MSYLVLGCPSCQGALEIGMHHSRMKPFPCVKCKTEIMLNRSGVLELAKDELLELLVDAAGYGAFYQELSGRDGSMGDATYVREYVAGSSAVREQMREWLKQHRARFAIPGSAD